MMIQRCRVLRTCMVPYCVPSCCSTPAQDLICFYATDSNDWSAWQCRNFTEMLRRQHGCTFKRMLICGDSYPRVHLISVIASLLSIFLVIH